MELKASSIEKISKRNHVIIPIEMELPQDEKLQIRTKGFMKLIKETSLNETGRADLQNQALNYYHSSVIINKAITPYLVGFSLLIFRRFKNRGRTNFRAFLYGFSFLMTTRVLLTIGITIQPDYVYRQYLTYLGIIEDEKIEDFNAFLKQQNGSLY